MNNHLIALVRNQKMGELIYDEKKDLITFQYDDGWRSSKEAFPISISMPFVKKEHDDKVARPFITGLLPDNSEVLEKWGRRFQVSARNPFRILYHIGEECAGAVQFVRPDQAERWIAGEAPRQINWITRNDLENRLKELLKDHAAARRDEDRGQFSLAGAQPKVGLYYGEEPQRWGVPEGEMPTTHILKPNEGRNADHDQNEYFCLTLAKHLDMSSAESRIEVIGEIPTIIVKRFDRQIHQGQIIRVHQEDACQALGISPLRKYEKDGGPTAAQIFNLIRDYSSKSRVDELRFLDALIYNWLIKGTDAHAKNFGFLLAAESQFRLAPLYDMASYIPYEETNQERKVSLAMKIGGEYKWWKIGPQHWKRAAEEWKINYDEVVARIVTMASKLPAAISATKNEFKIGGITPGPVMGRLEEGILQNAEMGTKLFSQS